MTITKTCVLVVARIAHPATNQKSKASQQLAYPKGRVVVAKNLSSFCSAFIIYFAPRGSRAYNQ
jgi:hypothetical protein